MAFHAGSPLRPTLLPASFAPRPLGVFAASTPFVLTAGW